MAVVTVAQRVCGVKVTSMVLRPNIRNEGQDHPDGPLRGPNRATRDGALAAHPIGRVPSHWPTPRGSPRSGTAGRPVHPRVEVEPWGGLSTGSEFAVVAMP